MLNREGTIMQSWDQMSRKDQLAATHYDFYKSVHGIRPRWMNYDEMTEQELEAQLEQLSKESDIQEKEDDIREAKASEDVEHVILNLRMSGAVDRAMAVRWLHEAHGTSGDNEYLCFTLGLPYGYFDKESV